MTQKTAVIIGAGPAGLTAAFELLEKTDIKPIVFEQTADIGGISKTVNYKGNRIDIGGHRFFSKSDRVVEWWLKILPLQTSPAKDESPENANFLAGKSNLERFSTPSSDTVSDPEKNDLVMLVRSRLSRILFMRKFFDYPISANMKTLRNLGVLRAVRILLSYLRARLAPIEEKSLEDFFINRFGKELYATFFKDYTEKVWGVPCSAIDPSWGAQRIKGLSVTKALFHAARGIVSKHSSLEQKDVETSLIERFMYPKFGPGQMWEEAARIIRERGGEVRLNHRVKGLKVNNGKISEAVVIDGSTGESTTVMGDYFISSMPIKDLIAAMGQDAPREVRDVAGGLAYRDFITVGLLLRKLPINTPTGTIPDNWIYVQEKDVKLGRIQIFNNWSPYMVRDDGAVWIGLEYFCNEGDELWLKPDVELAGFAGKELEKLGMIAGKDILDSTVIRMPKAYPCYFGSYERFEVIKKFTDTLENLFLIGRNGMHRYNNQDHSMLTAMVAVENIKNGISTKENIWSVNAEEEYHESK
ncbi:MAG: NAD(P)/FAD-dependent oxidoreductase [Deltaproteobacteria bacterium]|nr:NAD(P)/FAD-dependent oxidoreductase [Deltaproteobacteria bacterium]MBZ0218887.1 NAD(P)/FAD-dependent oxidoreductase [Deltaproteobacteria bacterium]